MATTTKKPKITGNDPTPPAEEFWIRYSPHHEAPVSGISSFVIHALAIGLVVLAILYIPKPDKTPPTVEARPVEIKSPALQPVRLAGTGGKKGERGGGGGSANGNQDGQGGRPDPGEEVGDPRGKGNLDDSTKPIIRENLTPTQIVNRTKAEFGDDADLVFTRPDSAIGKLTKISKGLRDQLRKGVNPAVGKGGTGKGGGRDTGSDKGQGSGAGRDTGTGEGGDGDLLNEREQRMLRWSMTFKTNNGAHYATQLRGLRAILAVPTPQGEYMVYRDFAPGTKAIGKVEDVTKLNCIFWIDEKRQSVSSLSSAIGWRPVPELFVAFFPRDIEEKLYKIEMAAARSQRPNVTENEIRQTFFDVVRAGGGYDVQVRRVDFK